MATTATTTMTPVTTATKQDECIELKNIKYKTMLLSGNVMQETKSSSDLSNLDKFLEDNKNCFNMQMNTQRKIV